MRGYERDYRVMKEQRGMKRSVGYEWKDRRDPRTQKKREGRSIGKCSSMHMGKLRGMLCSKTRQIRFPIQI